MKKTARIDTVQAKDTYDPADYVLVHKDHLRKLQNAYEPQTEIDRLLQLIRDADKAARDSDSVGLQYFALLQGNAKLDMDLGDALASATNESST